MSDITREEFDELKHQVQENTARLHDGDLALTKLDMRLGSIESKVDELISGVKAIQEKPAKRWDSLSSQILQWFVAAVLTFIAVKIGLA